MQTWKVVAKQSGGTIWAIPGLLMLALLSPSPILSMLTLGLLVLGLSLQLLPLLTVPEVNKSLRLAAQEKWAQANYYNILAQHKLRKSPWRGGFRPFRTRDQAPTLIMALRADAGRLQLGLGQPREAERVLRQFLREFPSHAPSYHNLALALHAQGKYRQAQAALTQAVDRGCIQPAWEIFWRSKVGGRLLTSSRLDYLEDRVAFYQSLGFHEIALLCLSDDGDFETIWRRVQSQLALGRNELAWRETWAELGEHPNNAHAWLSLGFLRALDGQDEEAAAAYRKALSLNHQSDLNPKNVTCKEQIFLLKARRADRRALLDALAVLAEYELEPRIQAMGKAIMSAPLGRWQAVLDEVAAAEWLTRNSSVFMELVAYAHLELGQRESGCRLLHRFCLKAEVSGLPMLDRSERLSRAKETLRRYRSQPGTPTFPRDSRTI